jgi:antitoxin MazE
MYTHDMVTKIQKWGNSLGVRLPRGLANEAHVAEGSEVDVQVRRGDIVLRPVRRKKYRLADLLAQITPENLPEKVDMGPPVGRELL